MPLSTVPPRSLADLRAFRALITMLAVLCALALAYLAWQVIGHFAHLLGLLLFASLLAFVLGPAVALLEGRGVPRALAVLAIYALIVGGVGLAIALAVGPLISQITGLGAQLPHYQQELHARLQSLDGAFAGRHIPFRPSDLTKQTGGTAQALARSALDNAVGILATLASLVVDVVLTVVLSIYLLIDARRIHDGAVRLVPASQRGRAFFVEAAVTQVVGGYIRGQLLMALLIGVLAGVGCSVLGVHYPLLIGVLAGLFELMPMIGPLIGAIPAVGVAFFQSPGLALWVALYYLAIQQLEAHVIGPRVTGHAVGLAPLGAIIALVAGVEVDGLVGALLGVPAVGILYVLAVAIYWEASGRGVPAARRRHALRRGGAPAPAHGGAGAPAPPEHPIEAASGVVAELGGDAPPPQALAGLEEQATTLREQFEQGEAARAREQETAALAQANQQRGGHAP